MASVAELDINLECIVDNAQKARLAVHAQRMRAAQQRLRALQDQGELLGRSTTSEKRWDTYWGDHKAAVDELDEPQNEREELFKEFTGIDIACPPGASP
jgi:hypothetical protein